MPPIVLFLKHRFAPAAAGLFVLVAITALLASVGAFSPPSVPPGFSSLRQLIGTDLLLIGMPAYLVFSWGLAERRSWRLLGEVDALLPEPAYQARARPAATTLIAGAAAGVVYAVLFNLPVGSVAQLLQGGALMIALVGGMILVWVAVGVTLASRLHTSRLFRQAGREVPVDLYDQTPLEPFARVGMGDVLLVVGALVLTTVQSIDATFRTENYFYAMLVAVPASLVLLLLPMMSVHARLREQKREELARLAELIRKAPRSLEEGAMSRLELLFQRRDRVQALHTWPLDVAMMSRIVLYGVIPPAAWIAAALVEQVLESLLGG